MYTCVLNQLKSVDYFSSYTARRFAKEKIGKLPAFEFVRFLKRRNSLFFTVETFNILNRNYLDTSGINCELLTLLNRSLKQSLVSTELFTCL